MGEGSFSVLFLTSLLQRSILSMGLVFSFFPHFELWPPGKLTQAQTHEHD